MIGNFFAPILDLIRAFLKLIEQIIELVIAGIQLIVRFVENMVAWIGQVIARINAIIQAFFSAQPVPIPGLPRCVSAPFSYDICAIYFIVEWTLMAENTPGSFITPLLLVVMGVVFVLYFIRMVLRLINAILESVST
jgi:hypothetical protein